ncbi:Uu.00g096750.m01.CDS01 [Anthostomella pinea]|uniref:Uu.00g096750.m01.CDS01 n=1 Tax=Anthostomella pinea TaxID=933095 RepID=A0AAI8VCD2_9PEZI|nr:Uu.00g096750.m01.CDS01 [Anthostomella pinea]
MSHSPSPSNVLLDSVVGAINSVSSFLADDQIRDGADLSSLFYPMADPDTDAQRADSETPPTDVVVLCASAVLYTAEVVFTTIHNLPKTRGMGRGRRDRKQLTDAQRNEARTYPAGTTIKPCLVLVICGGIGHSTRYMHEAVSRHPKYKQIAQGLQDKAEADVLRAIGERFFGLDCDTQDSFTVLVENKSTNCGANASMTRKLLESQGVHSPRSIVVAQDPTMCRRTRASFEKVYEDHKASRPHIVSWPTFVPQVKLAKGVPNDEMNDLLARLTFDTSHTPGLDTAGMWSMDRFIDLIMGEIPRLRDNPEGYGPNGKGFIAHVDIPHHVEEAWQVLKGAVQIRSER